MEIVVQNKQFSIAVSVINELEFYHALYENPDIKNKLKNFASHQRKCEWLNTHYLLYKLTGNLQTYYYNENNKPIASKSQHILSISHSERFTAIALSKNTQIGIDIEENNRNFIKIAPKYLHKAELLYLTNNDICQLIWCAKEALYKLINSASPNFSADYQTINIKENYIEIKYKNLQVYNIRYFKTTEYLLTWATNI